ncbi:putative ABC transport system permease protein [Natranaerovirga pectinivora]|uniref:Putative ABC transport system permease protein n=1 Tax=Natranaerovirga pectinivora TaxID=682400 RepID=A0A4V2V0I8_9FIRM|nr:FtsX-like permease family protein [Natranaerovirga pectinivora]TCT16257.1 putative ABC transport system permease protein [Natranaerovirga pectinivora]
MKNKTLLKDTYREIKGNLSRFLSIFAIVALGASFFAGIKVTGLDMKITANKYFNDYKLMDIRLVSTLGFTDDDVDILEEMNGIEGIMPTHITDTLVSIEDKELVVKVFSLPLERNIEDESYINRTKIVEGRYPENPNEGVVERHKIHGSGLEIGSVIHLSLEEDEDIKGTLKNNEFTIVGIVDTPYFISFERGPSTIGKGKVDTFIMIPEENFSLPVYTDIFITVSGARDVLSFNEEYKEIIDSIKEEILEVSSERGFPWIVLDRDTNPGFVDYGQAADKMDALAQVFPVIFFLVAALVSLTTMTRLVDEQRTYIGVFKALGFSNMYIASKYFLYALIASLSGSLLGVIIGFKLFPTVIFNAYAIMYTLPPVITVFDYNYALMAVLGSVLTTTIATLLACYKELTATAALLIRPKSPKVGKTILLERITFIWKRFNFIHKITARNIFRYKKRFLMTVFGIGGCSALLLTGFGLKDSISDIVRKQYEEIARYNLIISLREELDTVEGVGFLGEVDNEILNYLPVKEGNVNVGYKDTEKNIALLVPEDNNKLEEFILLQNRISKERVSLSDNGVILTEKLAKDLGVTPGGEIYFLDSLNNRTSVVVDGIVENYVFHYAYMSPVLYETLFDEAPLYNELLVQTVAGDEAFENRLSSQLIKETEVSNVIFTSELKGNFNDIIGSLNYVVLVLIVSAGALAFVVLYNLTNINISERQREIATIKVLGFYNNEVSAYVYRENLVLTIIGGVLGLVIGFYLHRFTVLTSEVDYVMFGRDIGVMSYFNAFVLTLGFSCFVNFVMYFRLRGIGMIESLKSIE